MVYFNYFCKMKQSIKSSLDRTEAKDYIISVMPDNNVVYLTFKKGAEITENVAREIILKRHKLQNGNTLPLMVIDLGAKTLELSALRLFASKRCSEYSTALAILIVKRPKNLFWYFQFWVMGLFTPISTRFFRYRESAENWLTYKQCNLDIKELEGLSLGS